MKLMKDENERGLDEKISIKGGLTVISKRDTTQTSSKQPEKPKKKRLIRRMTKKAPQLTKEQLDEMK